MLKTLWIHNRYSKANPIGVADGLDVGRGRKRGVKDDSKIFVLSK